MNRLSIITGTQNKSKMISRRMFMLSVAKTVVFLGIVGRLVFLQINESTKYKTLSDKNRFREWRIAPKRGVIKDFFGNEMATNEKVYQIHITPVLYSYLVIFSVYPIVLVRLVMFLSFVIGS